ncbi:MAG: EI24 domain-containing protein [Flavobacteriales bacterium]
MAFFRDLGNGSTSFFRAFGFALSNRMGWMFLVPTLLWILMAFGLFTLLKGPVDDLSDWVATQLNIPVSEADAGWWSAIKGFINGARELIVSIVLHVAIGYLLFVANKYIVLILLSPLLAYASERTEEIITGNTYPFSWMQLLRDALRGALIAMRNGIMELGISAGVWFLTILLPILSPFSVVLLFFVSSYFYGFSMFDYVFERRRLRIKESTRAVNDRMGLVMANGTLFQLGMMIPIFGIMFTPVMASVGAALATVKKEKAMAAAQAPPILLK